MAPVAVSETALLRRLMLRASERGARLFRNQVGTYHLKDGRVISSGFCKGSSDLIGYVPVTITPEMVGQTVAVFLAVEVKTATGRVSKDQQQFLDAVRSHGAKAGVVRSIADLEGVCR